MVFLDVFYCEDAVSELYPMLGIADDATVFRVVVRVEDMSAAALLRLFTLFWMSWAGPPRKLVLDQQKGFFQTVRAQLEAHGTEIDYVPRSAHHKFGRAERHNDAWRGIFRKTCDELKVVGKAEIDMAANGVSYATNSSITRCGAPPQQAVFGREMTLPDSLLGSPGGIGCHTLLSEDQRLFRRSLVRTTAVQKFYEWDLGQAFGRGKAGQARKYRGDFRPGDPVGVFYEYEGTSARARFVRGHVVA